MLRKNRILNKESKARYLNQVNPHSIGYSVYLSVRSLLSERFIGVSILVAVVVWLVWFILTGPSYAIANLIEHWEAAVTMAFGSLVAGGTSMGGGAVAFPVFTKVLHISPSEAKIFSLAIQSIGMSAASLTIVAMKTKVEWRFILWASLGGLPGVALGSLFLAPTLPPDVVKFSYTMMVCSFGLVLVALNRTQRFRNITIPFWSKEARRFSLLAGALGGTFSGLVGSGMDIVCFSVMLLFFGLCEKVSTPTSVILMAINALVGFGLHQYIIQDFSEPITHYWLAAIPVVVIGAPLGAILCNSMSRKLVFRILITLILLESVSSFLLIPLTASLFFYSLFIFAVFSCINYWMYKSSTYIVPVLARSRS